MVQVHVTSHVHKSLIFQLLVDLYKKSFLTLHLFAHGSLYMFDRFSVIFFGDHSSQLINLG